MIPLSVLIKKQKNEFIAHCLELDIVATAKGVEEVKTIMLELIREQFEYAAEHDNFDELFRPAPREVWGEFFAVQSQRRTRPAWSRGVVETSNTVAADNLSVQSVYGYA